MASSQFHGFLDAATYHFEQNRPLIPMYIHLLLSALFPIYTGAHASLSRPSSAAKPDRKAEDEDDDDEEETIQKMEGMTPKDAIVFPLTAGVVLAAMYWAIKTYGADMINVVLGVYFSLIGTFSVAKLINDSWTTVQTFMTPSYYRDNGKLWRLVGSERKAVALDGGKEEVASRPSPFPGNIGRLPLPAPLTSFAWSMRDMTKQKFSVKGYMKDSFDFQAVITRHNVVSAVLGVAAIGFALFGGKPWWLTNLQGFAVCYGALQLMSPTTFGTATLILSGLFAYDIWAVFFTPLMVTVAKNLDVPIKLVFPRPEEPSTKSGEPAVRSFSMLGLGDIVLPGLVIALALRFDLFMFYLRKQKKVTKATKDSKDESAESIEKAPYVSVTGNWGDKVWTMGASSSANNSTLPAHLRSHFPKPYFTATMIGYVVGMVATLVFMTVFQHAQPALLYLVPSTLVSLWGTALVRGEVKQMWSFTEAISGEPDKDESKEGKDGDNEAKSLFETIWSELFGSSKESRSDKKESEQAKTEDETAKAKKDEGKKNDIKVVGKETVFSLKITHHSSKSQEATSTEEDKDSATDEKAHKNHDSTSSVSEDTVLISSADLDGVKDSVKNSTGTDGNDQPRYRASSAQNGEAQKRTRLQ